MPDETVIETLPDAFFTRFVSLVEEGHELPVTFILVCDGIVISGELVSRVRYGRQVVKRLGESKALRRILFTVNAAFGMKGRGLMKEDEEERYFHMIDVTVDVGGREYETPVWRGRTADVSGFTLGIAEM